VDLKVANVIYFADWMPGAVRTLAYSTVTQQAAPPGWHTNNDLHILTIEGNQPGQSTPVELNTSMVGTYPWWGISFAWSPDGTRFAYANDHQVGLLTNLSKANPQPLLNFPHLQTGSEWAWVPGIAWAPDGKTLYCVDHVPQTGATSIEESQFFDLTAIPLTGGLPVHLASQVGMFAYPSPSPIYTLPSGEAAYQLAYLQAIVAAQSQTSRYRLWVMDRDGSNPRVLFPDEGARGLDTQRVIWSPIPLEDLGGQVIALIYEGNIWFISTAGEPPRQITGDTGDLLTVRIDWK